MNTHPEMIGFLGAGHMGSAMIARLCGAGFQVHVYDPNPSALAAAKEVGAKPEPDGQSVVRSTGIVLCSLPSSAAFATVAQEVILPAARSGLAVVDLGTTTTTITAQIRTALIALGADLLDAPVSGNPRDTGLRIFIGGDEWTVARCRPIFHALTTEALAVHVGPSCCGQIVKGVNQLAMGLVQAAYLEALSFGVGSGIPATLLASAVGGPDGFRREVAELAGRIADNEGECMDAKQAELEYFLDHAASAGLPMPLTKAFADICRDADREHRDNMGRPYASIWRQLMDIRDPMPSD